MDVSSAPTEASDYWKASTFQFGAALKIPIYAADPPPKVDTLYKNIYKQDTTVIVQKHIEERIEFVKSDTQYIEDFDGDNYVLTINEVITDYYNHYIPLTIGLDVAVETVGIDKEGKRDNNSTKITIEELEVEEGFPLLTHVFFKEGSSNIIESGLNLL
jgi:hypothetical protein